VLVLRLLRLRINQLPWRAEASFVGAHTSVSDPLEILENVVDLRSFPGLLVPTRFGDLPDL